MYLDILVWKFIQTEIMILKVGCISEYKLVVMGGKIFVLVAAICF